MILPAKIVPIFADHALNASWHRLEDSLMNDRPSGTALIIGVGDGLSASLARLLAREGYALVLAARDTDKLADLARETKADAHRCDAADPREVAALFQAVGPLEVMIYNPSYRVRGPLIE